MLRFGFRILPSCLVRCAAVFAALSAIPACQSFETGIQTICDAPSNCGAPCSTAPPDQQTQLFTEHAARAVRNDEASALLDQLPRLSADAGATSLREAATRAQLSSCRLADHLDSQSSKPAVNPANPPVPDL